MPKKTQHPRLRSHSWRTAGGEVKTAYYYDMRGTGKPDVPLGTDYDAAVAEWDKLHNKQPMIAGTLEEAFAGWEKEVLPVHKPVTRRGYALNLKRLRPVFGVSRWEQIDFRALKTYLKNRTAKTQGNQEMRLLRLVWNWARGEGMTERPFPAAGLEKSRWMNKEHPREFEVTDDLFKAIYDEGDQVLRDCMDLASATAMRLTDCRTILLPRDNVLRLKAHKTGKKGDFDVNLSAVLPDLIARRRAVKTEHLMLLSTPTGRPVSMTMLRDRYELARAAAAAKALEAGDEAFAERIKSMYLRDVRKYSLDLVETLEAASALAQHGDKRITEKHYRTKASRLIPAR